MFFLLLLFSLYIDTAIAAPPGTCDIEILKKKLGRLSLDNELRMNQELVLALQNKYGPSVSSFISKEHPLLVKDKLGRFDEQTMNWVQEAIWDPSNKISRYTPIIIGLTDTKVLEEYIYRLAIVLYRTGHKTELVFTDKSVFKRLKERVDLNFFNIIKERLPTLSDDEIANLFVFFKRHYLAKGNYHFGFEGIKKEKPVVVIMGHGAASLDEISLGNKHAKSSDIVDILMQLKLPHDATIKLNSCFSACNQDVLDYSMSEIVDLFTDGELHNIPGIVQGSFLENMSRTLHQNMPLFNGLVQGYLGLVIYSPNIRVLYKNGSFSHSPYGVRIIANDGKINLKKEDARISISHEGLSRSKEIQYF